MSSNIKLSVVVPVYNVETYLRQCLDSLINQTLKDIEIICVNDGSTDNSLAILEEYAKKDSRIKIITQENKGLSGARNTGMEHINGEYISFIDSDDWIKENAYEELYEKAKALDLDILMFQFIFFNQDTLKYEESQYTNLKVIDSSFDNKIFSYKDVLDVLFKIAHSPVNKIYKSSYIESLKINFHEGLNYEDIGFFFPVFLNTEKVSILRKPYYFYRIRDESISTSGGEKSFDIFQILKYTQEYIKEKNIYEKCMQEFLMYLIVNFKFVYLRLKEEFYDEYFNCLLKNYEYFNLDKVDLNYLKKWHYEDRSFYEAIKKSRNSYEFKLNFEKSSYEFLANHYEGLIKKLENENNNLKKVNKELSSSNFKNIFKKIFNK